MKKSNYSPKKKRNNTRKKEPGKNNHRKKNLNRQLAKKHKRLKTHHISSSNSKLTKQFPKKNFKRRKKQSRYLFRDFVWALLAVATLLLLIFSFFLQ